MVVYICLLDGQAYAGIPVAQILRKHRISQGTSQSSETASIMRYQGRITDWKDDKGFGFVAPNGGGPRVFVHIKAFSNRRRRPAENELVTYELTVDSRGRPQGTKVAFVGDRSSAPPRVAAPGPGRAALSFAFAFLAFVMAAVLVGRLPFVVLLVYIGASGLAYLAYVFDKAAAVNGRRRTPEISLHLFGLFGGWPGAMLAQKTLHHKTQKQSFQVAYWATVVLNCVALGWSLSPGAMRWLRLLAGSG